MYRVVKSSFRCGTSHTWPYRCAGRSSRIARVNAAADTAATWRASLQSKPITSRHCRSVGTSHQWSASMSYRATDFCAGACSARDAAVAFSFNS